jgi:two-component system sensor histidine kinase TctE
MLRESGHTSIRGRLIRWLLPLLLLILVVSSLLDYRRSIVPVEAAYDQALADAALAVAARLRPVGDRLELDLSDQSISVLRADTLDRIYFSVVGPSGRTIGGDPDLHGPAEVGGTTFFDGIYRGQPVRGIVQPVATLPGPSLVLVAETTLKRERARRELVVNRVLLDLSIVVLTVLVVWFAVGAALRPLDRIAAQMRQRPAGNLERFALAQAPSEVQPLLEALNRLFGLIGETQDSQRRFIENAAHQLRTPLTGLRAQVDLAIGAARAALEVPNPDPQSATAVRERLERIGEATARVTHLANQMLSLARSDRPSHATASRQPVELQPLVNDAVSALIDQALARDQDLGAETAPATVSGVEWQLRELLVNLIDNAIRHTPRGTRITVRCGLRGGAPYLEVEDTGPGIADDERARVFERFHRAGGAAQGGAGLGLAIVREIATLHAASIELDDPSQPPGAVFRVVFGGLIRPPASAQAAGV